MAQLDLGAGFAGAAAGTLNTAPFFLLRASHWPLLAPCAISSAVYAWMPAACWRTFAKVGLSLRYFFGGHGLISFLIARSRLPGFGDDRRGTAGRFRLVPRGF